MRYLLDTSVLVAVLRHHAAPVRRMRAVSPADIAVSVITDLELRVGARLHRESNREEQRVSQVLAAFEVLGVGSATVPHATTVKVHLRRAGLPIGASDLLIAATALEHELVLVTHDRDFRRVPGLRIEDWST